jgi:hypothetical protein
MPQSNACKTGARDDPGLTVQDSRFAKLFSQPLSKRVHTPPKESSCPPSVGQITIATAALLELARWIEQRSLQEGATPCVNPPQHPPAPQDANSNPSATLGSTDGDPTPTTRQSRRAIAASSSDDSLLTGGQS